MLASATIDTVPRVGVVLSSFARGEEHDGTKIAGLADPRPADAALTQAQIGAMLLRAMELSTRAGQPPRRRRAAQSSEDWVVFLIAQAPEAATDLGLLRSLIDHYAGQGMGRRLSVATASAPAPELGKLIAELKAKHTAVLVEAVDLSRDPYLQVPAARRTFAAKNPEGVYAVPRTIRECDRLITVSPLQTSPLTGVALSAARYWAVAPVAVYGAGHEKLRELGDLEDVLIDLYLHHPPDYAIVGGTRHRDAAGEVRHNIVIAGANAVAVDAIGAAVMGFEPPKLVLYERLEARGFGIHTPDLIWTRGSEIEDARRPFRKPAGF